MRNTKAVLLVQYKTVQIYPGGSHLYVGDNWGKPKIEVEVKR